MGTNEHHTTLLRGWGQSSAQDRNTFLQLEQEIGGGADEHDDIMAVS